jgi:hypothetical protein
VEKQKFLYAVLESKVETAKDKAIIHKYGQTYDAQKAFSEFKEYHLTYNNAFSVPIRSWNALQQLRSMMARGTVNRKLHH